MYAPDGSALSDVTYLSETDVRFPQTESGTVHVDRIGRTVSSGVIRTEINSSDIAEVHRYLLFLCLLRLWS